MEIIENNKIKYKYELHNRFITNFGFGKYDNVTNNTYISNNDQF